MSIDKAILVGLAGEKLSRTITGTNKVCASRSAVATATGATLGATMTGAIAVGASAIGASAFAAAAAPLVVPLAVAAGGIAFVRSLFD